MNQKAKKVADALTHPVVFQAWMICVAAFLTSAVFLVPLDYVNTVVLLAASAQIVVSLGIFRNVANPMAPAWSSAFLPLALVFADLLFVAANGSGNMRLYTFFVARTGDLLTVLLVIGTILQFGTRKK